MTKKEAAAEIAAKLTQDQLRLIAEEVAEILVRDGYVKRMTMDAKEAAEYLGIERCTLYHSLDRIPHEKFGRRKLVFYRSALDKMKEDREYFK